MASEPYPETFYDFGSRTTREVTSISSWRDSLSFAKYLVYEREPLDVSHLDIAGKPDNGFADEEVLLAFAIIEHRRSEVRASEISYEAILSDVMSAVTPAERNQPPLDSSFSDGADGIVSRLDVSAYHSWRAADAYRRNVSATVLAMKVMDLMAV